MKKKDMNEAIGKHIGKSDLTVKGWQKHHPELHELTSIGMFCKLNNLDIPTITKLIELKELIKGDK